MTSGRAIVLAPRLDDAKVWCLTHHVAPHGRNTVLRSAPSSVRALTFQAGDWLTVLPGTPWDVIDALSANLRLVSGPSIVSALNAWYNDWPTPGDRPEFSHTFGADLS